MNRALLFWVAVLAVFTGTMALFAVWRMTSRNTPIIEGGSSVVAIPHEAGGQTKDGAKEPSNLNLEDGFVFTERSGREMHSSDLDGAVYVASFFFASCPSTCRAQNQHMQILHRAYKGKNVKFLSITCDPEIDTTDVLSKYAKMFTTDADQWLFLRADMDYTIRVGNDVFGVPVDRQAHTERFVVVDQQGNICGRFHWAKPSEFAELQRTLDELLDERQARADGAAEDVSESPVDRDGRTVIIGDEENGAKRGAESKT